MKSGNNLMLPFSFHCKDDYFSFLNELIIDSKSLPIMYRINHDTSSPFKDILFERAVEFEAQLKFEIIDGILKECLQRYQKELDKVPQRVDNYIKHKQYQDKLMAFKKENKSEINLYRTR